MQFLTEIQKLILCICVPEKKEPNRTVQTKNSCSKFYPKPQNKQKQSTYN